MQRWTSIVLLVWALPKTRTYVVVPNMNDALYAEMGHLNIGAVLSLTSPDNTSSLCGTQVTSFDPVQMAEAIVYAVQNINKNSSFLPNIKLGYIITDACNQPTAAALQAVRFLPKSHADEYNYTDKSYYLRSFDVIGVIGTEMSSTTKLVADVLIRSRIPIISVSATDASFNDNVLYPILYRMIPPYTTIAIAIEQFFMDSRWLHFNVVIKRFDGTESIFQNINQILARKFECIGEIFEVDETFDFCSMIMSIVNDALASRIVLVLADDFAIENIISATAKTKTEGKILWVGLDQWVKRIATGTAPLGSIGLTDGEKYRPAFLSHLKQLSKGNKNPWYFTAFKELFNCTDAKCITDYLGSTKNIPNLTTSVYNAVMILAKALFLFYTNVCPHTKNREAVRCFKRNRHQFAPYISQVSLFEGSEVVRFTSAHYIERSFTFIQSAKQHSMLKIAFHDWHKQSLRHMNPLDLSVYQFNLTYLDPMTYCTPKCSIHDSTFYISKCCYICKSCKESEIVNQSLRQCQVCPPFYWPHTSADNTRECELITPFYLNFHDGLSRFLLLCSTLGVFLVFFVGFLYWRKRSNNVVKASNVELSIGQLACFLTGYLSIPVYLLRPTHVTCTVGTLMFMVSFNNSYMLMLIKALRVHRIFMASLKAIRRVSFTQTKFVVSVSIAYLIFEVVLFLSIGYFYPMEVHTHQPDPNENYVEMACVMPKVHVVAFLLINFSLLLMSAVLAFKTRVLPERYRDTHLITICIVTTMILWSSFLPVFMLSRRNLIKVVTILIAILINHTVTFICIFFVRLLEAFTDISFNPYPIFGT